jgi:hypothetical protein
MRIQSMKIAPHLFVGLGGCGSKIVNEIARKFKGRSGEERYRNLVHFFAFDTDVGELKQCDAVDYFVPIGNFDKREFVEHAFGQRGAPEDSLFTSWWPEYYQPRATSGSGAGQIRIESRLSVYRTLKAVPQHLTTIRNAIRSAYDTGERFRDVDKQPMVHIYASLAGGTGSGSFLALAYLMRDMVSPHQNPIVVGTFVMPGVFTGMGLPTQQLDKIMANGYAALMELEYLQGATDSPRGTIRFQYDQNAKEPIHVVHGPFNQVYLVDDVSKLSSVLSNAREVYPSIADAAYTQVFTDIIERDRSTADNDEREIAVSDDQHYTKRYGSFGLSALVLPDRDILEYAGHRFAAEAIERAFALRDDDAPAGRNDPRGALTPEQREQQFVQELKSLARLPGEIGTFYGNAIDWVDGSETGGTGALADLLRRIDAQINQLDRRLETLPRISEDALSEYENAPDQVRAEMPRRLDAWKTAVAKARDDVTAAAKMLAAEVVGDAHEHSIGRITKSAGMLRSRYLLFKLEAALRERQSAAGAAERQHKAQLEGWEARYASWTEKLVEAAPRKFIERFTHNDYDDEVTSFVERYAKSLLSPQVSALKAGAELELYDTVLKDLAVNRESTASLFGELGAIRRELLAKAKGLLEQGVGRQRGGQAQEFMLDVEVYQDHLDPAHVRLWNVVYRSRVSPEMFNPEQISRTIDEARRSVEGERHVPEAVMAALVELGRDKLRKAITGDLDPKSLADMGLVIGSGLEEQARISRAWQRLRDRTKGGIEDVPPETWKTALADVTREQIDDYVREVLAHAAYKCAPFWRLSEEATKIEPKRYITVHDEYRGDEWMRQLLTNVAGFAIPEGNLLPSPEPKRIVFYWNEMGVPIYRVQSIDEYGRRYEFVKADELRRGHRYTASELRFRSCAPEQQQHQAECEGQLCPDVPLHIDRCWEGAPDPKRRLFPITMEAVRQKRAKIAWEAERNRLEEVAEREATDRAEIRAFALCRALGLVTRTEGEGYVFCLDEIKNVEDRALGAFLDEARDAFGKAREVVKGFVLKRMEARLAELVGRRDRAAIEGLLKPYIAALEVEVINARQREAAIIKEELALLEEELRKLLEQA